MVAAHDPGRSMRLERNPQWDASTDVARAARVESVDWSMGIPSDPGFAEVEKDRFDLTLDLAARGPLLERIVTDPQLLQRFINEPLGCTRYIFLNTRIKPFDDPLVRQAVNLAIDRATLKRIYGGPVTGPVAESVIPPGIPGHLSASSYSPFRTEADAGNIREAKKVLARAGYPNGYSAPVRIVGAAHPPLSRIFESVVADLRRLGFSHLVTLQPPASEEYSKYYGRAESETAVGTSAGWCKDYPQPYSFLAPVLTTSPALAAAHTNYSGLNDPELSSAIDRAMSEADPAAALPQWQEANRLATESGAWIPWSWDESTILLGPRVRDARFLPFLAQVDWFNASLGSE
jgi:peptide/nickel transport system substrate-binding protein